LVVWQKYDPCESGANGDGVLVVTGDAGVVEDDRRDDSDGTVYVFRSFLEQRRRTTGVPCDVGDGAREFAEAEFWCSLAMEKQTKALSLTG
jgi:hypothetical protein